MGGVQQFTVRSGQPEQTVDFGVAGGTVSVVGGTVWYRDEPGVTATSADGSIASGSSATLYGTQFFSTVAARADGQVRLSDVVGSSQAVADHVAAADPHGDRKLAALLSMGRFYPAMVGVDHSMDSLAQTTRDGGNALNALTVTPMYSGSDGVTLSQWRAYVVTGVATAQFRIGVWTIDDQANPLSPVFGTKWATLLTDLGVLDCSTSGVKTIATSVAIPARTWFAVGGVSQTALATITIGTSENGIGGPFGVGVGTPSRTLAAGGLWTSTGVSGALPDFTPIDVNGHGHGIGARRSA